MQAIIFGAGHAPYPNQPSFARPVELIIPSIGFGLLYLYFGLLPGIVLHFTFDVVWFALPIFIATAPGIWFQQFMVVALTLVPLWIVLWRRDAGRTLDGAAVRPSAMRPGCRRRRRFERRRRPQARTASLGASKRLAWLVAGALALAACSSRWRSGPSGEPRFAVSRQQAADTRQARARDSAA